MKNSNILAVDAMGGDFGPSVVVPGALKAGQKCGAKILLVGIESAIQEVLDTLPDDLKTVDFSIVHASQVVDMHENHRIFYVRRKILPFKSLAGLLRTEKPILSSVPVIPGPALPAGCLSLAGFPGLNVLVWQQSCLRKQLPGWCLMSGPMLNANRIICFNLL